MNRGHRAAPSGRLFPLTPTLSLGERVSNSRRGERSRSLGVPLRDARYFLSLGERIKVRGNGAKTTLARIEPFLELVELHESSGGAEAFLKPG